VCFLFHGLIVSMIRVAAAIDDKRGLATDKGIPWKLPGEQAHERQETKGGNILMGYNTYLEFKVAPPDRNWFVVTDRDHSVREGFTPVLDLKAFMEHPPEKLWLFGGAGVFAQTIDYAEELYLTRVDGDFHCTKFFPEFEDEFELVEQGEPKTENGTTFRYETWKKKPK
jgi:dihydrofolate reductase